MLLRTSQAVNITEEYQKTLQGKQGTFRESIGFGITTLLGVCFLIVALLPLTTGFVNQLLRVAFFVLFGSASFLGVLFAVASRIRRKNQSGLPL
jgi:hypothetical protein